MAVEYVKETYQMQLKPLIMRPVMYYGDKEAIYSADHHGKEFRCTWREEFSRLCRLANALEKLGIERGDKVGTLAWNTHRHVELSLAVPMMGAVFHPMNFRLSREHLIHCGKQVKDRVIFVDEDIIPLLEDVKDELKTVEAYVIMTPLDKLPQTKLSPVYSYEELISQASSSYDFPDDIPETSLAILCHSGGTTGLPKGVGFTPRSIVLYCLGMANPEQTDYREEDTIMTAVNLFHINAHHIQISAAMQGAKLVLPGPHPSPDDQLKIIEQESVTGYWGVGTVIMFALQEWEKGKYDLGCLKKIFTGAVAPSKAIMENMHEKGLRVFWGYGLAESRTITHSLVSHRKYMEGWSQQKYFEKLTHQGLPLPGAEVRVVNLDTGKDVAWDGKEKGEVLLRGLWVGQEYYNDPEGSSKVFEDGWLRAGDLAVVEEDGHLYLVDRIKDIIKSGGEWISSIDLENAIMDNPVVKQAAVFGIPHPQWDERPVAAVVLKDEYKGKVTKEDIIKPLQSRVAKWWMPDHVVFMNELPMTGTMKVMKRVLKDMWVEGKLKASTS